MSAALSIIVVVLLGAACVGFGSMLLAIAGVNKQLDSALERNALCFMLGLGIFGWVLFFPGIAGYLRPEVIWGVALIGAMASIFHLSDLRFSKRLPDLSRVEISLVVVLVIVLFLDLLEGLSPPADADTLAYHFALPRDFLASGQIVFVPRAVSGAIPLLLHMSYAAALGAGGELALTLWAMVTGWAPALLLYAIMRRVVPRPWALMLALLFLTTPAVLYGGGNGQTEIRCAGFALACAAFVLLGIREGSLRLIAIAGLCAGFFIGAKYYGLIFAGAVGLILLFNRKGLPRGLIFGIAAVLAGFQWYLWNWVHTGDPVFPMLTNLLQFPDTDFWSREFGLYFSEILAKGELPLERSVLNWISYPILSIFNVVERLEGGRTGFGVLIIIIFPLAVAGLIKNAERRRDNVILLAIAIIFFTVWFFSGTTQRSRHLLTIYPLILIALFATAVTFARKATFEKLLAVVIGVTFCIQLAGQTIFSVNHSRYVFGSESRAEFLDRNVPGANGAAWINQELPETVKIGFMNRQLAYLIERETFLLHPYIQTVVDARPEANDERKFITQVGKVGISHFLISNAWQNSSNVDNKPAPFFAMIGQLVDSGCLKQLQIFDTANIRSRTLLSIGGVPHWSKDTVLEIVPARCPAPL